MWQTLKDKHDKFIVLHPFIDYTKYLLGDCCASSALGWDTVLWKTKSLPPSTQYSGEVEQPVNKLTSECSARCERWEVKQTQSRRRRAEMEERALFSWGSQGPPFYGDEFALSICWIQANRYLPGGTFHRTADAEACGLEFWVKDRARKDMYRGMHINGFYFWPRGGGER